MAFSEWQPGMRMTADRLRGSTPQAPLPWIPAWTTSSGTATPSYGNAVVTAEYTHFGRLCAGRIEIAFGTTTNFGGGGAGDNWRFSTPVPANSTAFVAGWGELQGPDTRMGARVRLTSTNTFELEVSSGRVDGAAGGSGIIDAVSPWTWASGSHIRFDFRYSTAT